MPNGWGKQKLYDIKIEYKEGSSGGSTIQDKIGFRTVELVEDDLPGTIQYSEFGWNNYEILMFSWPKLLLSGERRARLFERLQLDPVGRPSRAYHRAISPRSADSRQNGSHERHENLGRRYLRVHGILQGIIDVLYKLVISLYRHISSPCVDCGRIGHSYMARHDVCLLHVPGQRCIPWQRLARNTPANQTHIAPSFRPHLGRQQRKRSSSETKLVAIILRTYCTPATRVVM